MIEFAKSLILDEASNPSWNTLIKYAIAYETYISRYKHYWRQLGNYEYGANITSPLEQFSENVIDLLWRLSIQRQLISTVNENDKSTQISGFFKFGCATAFPFYHPWFCSTYTGQISGSIDIIYNDDSIVGIECADGFSTDRALELQIYASIWALQNPHHPNPSILMVLPSKCQLFTVSLKKSASVSSVPIHFEIIHRAARRKLQLPAASGEELVQDFQGKSINPRMTKRMKLFV